MPIYEYKCENCNQVLEVIHKISERNPINCPICSTRMNKLISKSSFILKGDGWYATEKRKDASKKVIEANT